MRHAEALAAAAAASQAQVGELREAAEAAQADADAASMTADQWKRRWDLACWAVALAHLARLSGLICLVSQPSSQQARLVGWMTA